MNKLVIKAFHVENVVFSEKTALENGVLSIKNENNIENFLNVSKKNKNYIKEVKVKIIEPHKKDVEVNSIMDFIPISTKVLGEIGNGITHTLTGVTVMLTGSDILGNQICEFGKSNGILKNVVKFGMAGTPETQDYIIHINLTVFEKSHVNRECIDCCHEICDLIIDEVREVLKKKKGRDADERHDYIDIPNPDGKNIVILKQVAGQGAMYDTRLFPNEPSGFSGSYSIIDFMNMPVFISKNEYRDGAIRAMH
ncbi:MAG: proline reductase cluster protein PrdD [Cetobacterium sp.]